MSSFDNAFNTLSKPISSANTFANDVLRAPLTLPGAFKKYFINSALVMSRFLNTFLPSAVFSLNCLPVSGSTTASLNSLKLRFIVSCGIAGYIFSKLSLKNCSYDA